MNKLYVTSDTHFGHTNIIKYCGRPFDTLGEMDSTIIDNWNSVVGKNDLVYHLGDFSMGNPRRYRKYLNGKIKLLRGNHDRKSIHDMGLFESVRDMDEIKHKLAPQGIILCHYSMRIWNRSHFNSYHLYGHSHGTSTEHGKSMDVGVDACNFTPLSIEEVAQAMSTKPDNFNLLK